MVSVFRVLAVSADNLNYYPQNYRTKRHAGYNTLIDMIGIGLGKIQFEKAGDAQLWCDAFRGVLAYAVGSSDPPPF